MFLIFLALLFDFLNGFHDAANSIATVVSTRVLSPRYAVAWAAFFNFIAFLFFGLHVAGTIGKGIIDISIIDKELILATLVAACLWDIITWYFGLPTSSSHALMGGLIGAAIVKAGLKGLIWSGILKTIAFIFISPLLGLFLGLVFGTIVYRIFRRSAPTQVDKYFRKGQLVSAALYSLGHGGNDAQKTMGQKVAKLRPVDGFCAESAAAATLYFSTFLGVPVSTTHTITGSIMGVGAMRSLAAVRWGVAGQIVWAWVLTIPCAAVISAVVYCIVS
ncbi:MAG TPA: inorganic phosphate transporter [Spirochaetota bacterium]|nr:inorganic phosphate transporter [Spirochaetota bacterium]